LLQNHSLAVIKDTLRERKLTLLVQEKKMKWQPGQEGELERLCESLRKREEEKGAPVDRVRKLGIEGSARERRG
jgi:hypothetical protein